MAASGPLVDYEHRFLPPLADALWNANQTQDGSDPLAAIRPWSDCLGLHCAEACQLEARPHETH
ncbi:MAG TPA: hypothetical protein VGI70_17915 [Polyangiales bacterium]